MISLAAAFNFVHQESTFIQVQGFGISIYLYVYTNKDISLDHEIYYSLVIVTSQIYFSFFKTERKIYYVFGCIYYYIMNTDHQKININ